MKIEKQFLISRLNSSDIQRFRSLLGVFGQAFEDVGTYTGAQPSTRYLKRLLGGDQFIALAAIQSDEVIGGLAAYVLQKFEQERSEIYIYDLAVLKAHRRKGVATSLISELQNLAALHGAYVIFVQADPPDESAVALYSKLGIKEEVFHFDIAPMLNSSSD